MGVRFQGYGLGLDFCLCFSSGLRGLVPGRDFKALTQTLNLKCSESRLGALSLGFGFRSSGACCFGVVGLGLGLARIVWLSVFWIGGLRNQENSIRIQLTVRVYVPK